DIHAGSAEVGHRSGLVRRDVPYLHAAWADAAAARVAPDDNEERRTATNQDEPYFPVGGALHHAEPGAVGVRILLTGSGGLVTQPNLLGAHSMALRCRSA